MGPYRVAEFSKRQVGLFTSHCVRVDPECQRWIGVAQLICNPTDDSTGVKCEYFPNFTECVLSIITKTQHILPICPPISSEGFDQQNSSDSCELFSAHRVAVVVFYE